MKKNDIKIKLLINNIKIFIGFIMIIYGNITAMTTMTIFLYIIRI